MCFQINVLCAVWKTVCAGILVAHCTRVSRTKFPESYICIYVCGLYSRMAHKCAVLDAACCVFRSLFAPARRRNPRCYCLRSRHSARAQPRLTCARLLNTHTYVKNDNSVAARVRVIILFRSLARAHVKQREDVHPPARALKKQTLSLEWVNEQHAGDGKQTRGDKTSTRAPH
jgi:hypothetical protein